MANSFDPYHVWLGIPPEEQPPNHYRLLGLTLFEWSPEVIDHAADQRMAHLRTFQAGQNGHLSQQLLNEVSAARLCLLNPDKKAGYDDQLRLRLSPTSFHSFDAPLPPLPEAIVPFAGYAPAAATIHSLPASRPRADPQRFLIVGGLAVMALGGVIVLFVVFGQSQPSRGLAQRRDQPAPIPPSLPKTESNNTSGNPPAPPRSSPPELAKPTPPEPQPAPPVAPPQPPDVEPAPKLPDAPGLKEPLPENKVLESAKPVTPNKIPVADRSFVVDLSLPLALPGATAPAAERLAVPEPEQLETAQERVHSVFKADFAAAKTTAQKEALAAKLLENAAGTGDAAERYALLVEAGDLAARAGEVNIALKTADDLAGHFELEPIPLKGRLLGQAAKVNSPTVARNVAEASLELADQSLALERAELVKGFTKIAIEASRKARDVRFANEVRKREVELKQLSDKLPSVQEARATLSQNAENSAANEIVGRWLCFDLEQWDVGLPYLAKSEQGTFQKLAALELKEPDSGMDQLELADGWWEAAAVESATLKAKLQTHAAEWYRAAHDKLTGLDKVKIDKRLEALGAKRQAASSSAQQPAKPPKLRFVPVCSLLQAKRPPDGLVKTALAFEAPAGDGRRGANGFFLATDSWIERGTAWICDYQRTGTARCIQFLHPYRNGHVLVTAGASSLHVASIDRWSDRTYIPNEPGFALQKANDFGANYYLAATPRKLLSYLGPEGDFRFYVDGTLVATAAISDAQPFHVTSDFKGVNLPGTLPAGMAGIIIGPTDGDPNTASEVAFGEIAPRTAPAGGFKYCRQSSPQSP